MPRVTTQLVDADASINVRLQFVSGDQGVPEIVGAATGSLVVRCQRCLGPVEWPVELGFHLTVVDSEEKVATVAEPFDTLVADGKGVDLLEILEDELLASMPLAPAHAVATDCEPLASDDRAHGAGSTDSVADVADVIEQESTKTPFADLADMLQQARGKN